MWIVLFVVVVADFCTYRFNNYLERENTHTIDKIFNCLFFLFKKEKINKINLN